MNEEKLLGLDRRDLYELAALIGLLSAIRLPVPEHHAEQMWRFAQKYADTWAKLDLEKRKQEAGEAIDAGS